MRNDSRRVGRLRRIRDAAGLDRIFRLRYEVWVERIGEQAFFENGRWRDAYDVESAIQLAAIEDGAIVAAARLTFHESLSAAPYGELFGETAPDAKAPFAAFGRLIVHPSYEGQGLASRLDRARRRIAIAHGSRTMVAVTSNPKRITALSRCGFAPTSDAQARTEYGVLVTTLSSRAAT